MKLFQELHHFNFCLDYFDIVLQDFGIKFHFWKNQRQ